MQAYITYTVSCRPIVALHVNCYSKARSCIVLCVTLVCLAVKCRCENDDANLLYKYTLHVFCFTHSNSSAFCMLRWRFQIFFFPNWRITLKQWQIQWMHSHLTIENRERQFLPKTKLNQICFLTEFVYFDFFRISRVGFHIDTIAI